MKSSNNKPRELPKTLKHLMSSGVRAEKIAVDLDVAFGTVKSWINGRRKPKKSTVAQIEHLYGVKIL